MRIVCDIHIPFLVQAVHQHWPDVEILPLEPDEITPSAVREADVLVIRTRTKVNEQLLAGSHIRLVCTATIGFDHIDTHYCETHDIQWISCPGCNAQAVCDYIEQVLTELNLNGTIGVVGVGHVGALVAQMAERRGLKVMLNDPPKQIGISLDEIAHSCDIITFHTPLDSSTFHLCDELFLTRCKPHALIINAARGGIVDELALLRSAHPFVLDTWENEPDINPDVLARAQRASMHIAGYSVQGKRNATQMCLNAIADTFKLPSVDISLYSYSGPTDKQNSNEPWLAAITAQLKATPTAFETLRKAYPLRGE